MSVLVATAYMDEAQRFDWLVAMDDGKVLATGTPAELLARTGTRVAGGGLHRPAARGEEARPRAEVVIPPPLEADADDIAIEAKGLTMRFGDFVAVDQRVVSHPPRRDLRLSRLQRLRQVHHHEDAHRPAARQRRPGLAVRPGGGPEEHRHAPRVGYMSQAFSLYGELTVRQNLVLHARLFHVPEAAIAARGCMTWCSRFGLADVPGQPARQPAAGHAPAPVAGGGHGAPARAADPRRADLGRGPGGARCVLAAADRAVAARPGDDLHLHPLHERGRALRPHVDDARRPVLDSDAARRPGGQARRGHAGRGLHRLPGGGRVARRGSGREDAPRFPPRLGRRPPHPRSRCGAAPRRTRASACSACSATCGARRWSCSATRCAPRWRWPAR